jgi:hypothetical protein
VSFQLDTGSRMPGFMARSGFDIQSNNQTNNQR